MTKAELLEYVEELEGAIEDAYAALEGDDAEKAAKILGEYIDEEGEVE